MLVKKINVVEVKETTIELRGTQIAQMLKRTYPDLFDGETECHILFDVPRGGDYSGITLDINEEPLRVVITKTSKIEEPVKGLIKFAEGLYEVSEDNCVTSYVVLNHRDSNIDDLDNEIFSVAHYGDETDAFIASVKAYTDAHNSITFLMPKVKMTVSEDELYRATGIKKGKIKFKA